MLDPERRRSDEHRDQHTLNGLTTGTWAIDPTHSEVGFVARHLMVTKVRGSFADVAGTVEVAEEHRAERRERHHQDGLGLHRHRRP